MAKSRVIVRREYIRAWMPGSRTVFFFNVYFEVSKFLCVNTIKIMQMETNVVLFATMIDRDRSMENAKQLTETFWYV